jgi:hypothetical protein
VAGEPNPLTILLLWHRDEADDWRHDQATFNLRPGCCSRLAWLWTQHKPRRSYTIQFLSNAILELLELLNISSALIGQGSSLETTIAQALALEQDCLAKRSGAARQHLGETEAKATLLLFMLPGWENGPHPFAKNPHAYETLRPYYRNLDSLSEEEQQFLYLRQPAGVGRWPALCLSFHAA